MMDNKIRMVFFRDHLTIMVHLLQLTNCAVNHLFVFRNNFKYYTISIMSSEFASPDYSIPSNSLLRRNYMTVTVKAFQLVYWSVLQLPVRLLVHKKTVLLTKADLQGKKYIIASNHQSQLDPFILVCCLPFSIFWHLAPIRFMAHNGLFSSPVMKWFQLTAGSFPAHQHEKYDFGLPGSEYFLKSNQPVLIFPEGKRVLYGTGEAKRGVSILADTDNTMLIPAKIVWYRRGILRWCKVTINRPISAKGKSPGEILDIIYNIDDNRP